MTEKELREIIASKRENEAIEFKTAERDFSVFGGSRQEKRCLYGYCVGIGNEGGGCIIFGVSNEKKIVGTQAFQNLEEVRADLYRRMGVKIVVQEFFLPQRIVVVDIPSRRPGKLFEFFGRYLTRVGEELVEMQQDEIAAVLGETQEDFSAKFIDANIGALSDTAIRKVRDLYEKKAQQLGQDAKTRLTNEQFLKVSYRNRRLAESLEKIGFVERSGQGADLIFENTIREGKGIPSYTSTQHDVTLVLSAIIKDPEIVAYFDEVTNTKNVTLSIDDLVLLEKIKERSTKGLLKRDVQKFIDAGIVVTDGVGRGMGFFLSKQYYKDHNRLGEYTKIRGLKRAGVKELILQHLEEYGKVRSEECQQISPSLSSKDITNILQELRRGGKIQFVGPQRSKKSYWTLIDRN